MKAKIKLITAITFMGCIYWGCEKEEGDENSEIRISDMEVTERKDSSLTIQGKITNTTDKNIHMYGFVFDTLENPTFDDDYRNIINNSKSITIDYTVDNLLPGRKYYIRPYAISQNDTLLGEEFNISTTYDVYLAHFTYSDAFDITTTSFKTSIVFQSHGLGPVNELVTLIYDSTGTEKVGGLGQGNQSAFLSSTFTLETNWPFLKPNTLYKFRVEASNLYHPYHSGDYRSPIFSELRTFRTAAQ